MSATNETGIAGSVPRLVSCPFCGRAPHMTNRGHAWWAVKCQCGVMTFECHTEGRALEIWNARASNTDSATSVRIIDPIKPTPTNP